MKTAIELDHHGSWLHEAFLARAAEPGNEEGRHALGAFLTMRLADRFDPAGEPAQPLALAYQVRATRDYLTDLAPQNVEATHLMQVVFMADAVQRGSSRAILWPPLLAYASWLEQELRLGEALDVVDTALRLNDGRAPTEEIAALLQQGRILRLVGQMDQAKESYEAARVKAIIVGDMHSQLLGRIGQAIVMRQLGNLSGSEKDLRVILGDAEAVADYDAQARAHHDLGAALLHQRRGAAAVTHLFRAFELYDRNDNRLRALSDVGEALKAEGQFAPAKDAFAVVLRVATSTQVKAQTMTALLELCALTGDRVGFARMRRTISPLVVDLPPERLADFYLLLGKGQATFGDTRTAERSVRKALEVADQHKLNEYRFRAEAALKELAAQPAQRRASAYTPRQAEKQREFTEVAQKLHALAVA